MASADSSKTPKWSDITSDKGFQNLDWPTRQQVRARYFDRVVRPEAPEGQADLIQDQFFTRTESDVFGSREGKGQSVIADVGKGVAGGASKGFGLAAGPGLAEPLEAGSGLIEKGLRAAGLGGVIDKGDEALGGWKPSDVLRGIGDWFDKGGEQIKEGQSEAFKKAVADSTPEGDVTDFSTWSLGKDPSVVGYMGHMADVVGQFSTVLLGGAALKGTKLAAKGGMALLGGLQAGGSQADEARDRIANMPEVQLEGDRKSVV